MRTGQETAKESRKVECNYKVLNQILAREHLANRLLKSGRVATPRLN